MKKQPKDQIKIGLFLQSEPHIQILFSNISTHINVSLHCGTEREATRYVYRSEISFVGSREKELLKIDMDVHWKE